MPRFSNTPPSVRVIRSASLKSPPNLVPEGNSLRLMCKGGRPIRNAAEAATAKLERGTFEIGTVGEQYTLQTQMSQLDVLRIPNIRIELHLFIEFDKTLSNSSNICRLLQLFEEVFIYLKKSSNICRFLYLCVEFEKGIVLDQW